MRLTTFTDFGLRTLMYLASLPPEQLSSVTEVTKVYHCSQNHLVKVVGQLSKLGYLQTTRGKYGGICLAMSPRDINIGQVIRQMEKHLDGVDCTTSECELVGCCKLKAALQEAMGAFLEAMGNYTLADLVENQEQLTQIWKVGEMSGSKKSGK
ncbi:Rrf2 family transcriptional regulator [uncultured Shewanella sp.]|uniref:Rrf2 family transcriptional regulator n=1 Tax=uncultured Shewanella sp. TaxID=173975 RepID=UPI002615F384|nr:Rrf2 family transcriptional regulator [uncultured Shewanella sp.]